MIQLKNVTLDELAARSADRESWRYLRLGTVVRFQAARLGCLENDTRLIKIE